MQEKTGYCKYFFNIETIASMIYKFERDPVGGIILVEVRLNKIYKMKMALDTAASITTFDFNALHVVNYPIGAAIETGMVETASGIMPVDIIETTTISAFGHTVSGMNVQVYDYLVYGVYGIVSGYDGVLGLDFFENTVFTIDLEEQTIEVKSKKWFFTFFEEKSCIWKKSCIFALEFLNLFGKNGIYNSD